MTAKKKPEIPTEEIQNAITVLQRMGVEPGSWVMEQLTDLLPVALQPPQVGNFNLEVTVSGPAGDWTKADYQRIDRAVTTEWKPLTVHSNKRVFTLTPGELYD